MTSEEMNGHEVVVEGESPENTARMPSGRVYVGNLSWKVRAQDLREHMERCGPIKKVDIFEDYNGRSKGCAIVEYSDPHDGEKAIRELTDTKIFDRPIFVREDREEAGGATARRGNTAGRGYRNRDEAYRGSGNGNGDENGNGDGNGDGSANGNENEAGDGYKDERQLGGRPGGYGGFPSSRPNGARHRREDDYGRLLFVSNLPYKTSWQDLKDLFRKCGHIIRADVMCYPDGRSRGVGTVLFNDTAAAEMAITEMNGHLLEGRQISVRLDRG